MAHRMEAIRKLGIDNDLAKLTSYCGDRYEREVRRTCVARTISKEILLRRGLVGCLDYYSELALLVFIVGLRRG